MKLEEIRTRLIQLINKGKEVLTTEKSPEYTVPYVDSQKFFEFRTASLSFLERLFGNKYSYVNEFNSNCKDAFPSDTRQGIGILQAVKDEIEGGWLFTIDSLISAEIFSDFLEMADYLLAEGFKDPAAVMIGSVLEEHLRKLCKINSLAITINKNGKVIPKKADLLNSELSNKNVYNKLDQKSVTSWLDLRNKAAHGKYSEYTKDQVILMLEGVRNFMIRNPIE